MYFLLVAGEASSGIDDTSTKKEMHRISSEHEKETPSPDAINVTYSNGRGRISICFLLLNNKDNNSLILHQISC